MSGNDILQDSFDECLPGMLSAFMAFLEPGDETIVFEPFFDQ